MRQAHSLLRYCCALLFALACSAQAATPDCPADRIDETVAVQKVHDGDTLVLRDGRKIRLIALNTPELARNGRPAETYAGEARDALRVLVEESDRRIALRHDRERHDRYARTLSHVFTGDGRNAAAVLLRDGLGAPVTVPPNLWAQRCYRDVAAAARARQTGIWRLRRYHGMPTTELGGIKGGYYVVQGTVERLGESRKAVWLNLAHGFALRLAKRDLGYFDALPPATLVGRNVRVGGWTRRYNETLQMTLRHPAQLELLD